MSVEATLQRFPVFWCFGLRSQPDRKYSAQAGSVSTLDRLVTLYGDTQSDQPPSGSGVIHAARHPWRCGINGKYAA